MHLDESELFITLVSQDFAKESNLVILFGVLLYSINDACCLLNDQILQAISLVKKSVHVLFHGFSW